MGLPQDPNLNRAERVRQVEGHFWGIGREINRKIHQNLMDLQAGEAVFSRRTVKLAYKMNDAKQRLHRGSSFQGMTRITREIDNIRIASRLNDEERRRFTRKYDQERAALLDSLAANAQNRIRALRQLAQDLRRVHGLF